MANTLTVHAPNNVSYDIRIEPGLLANVAQNPADFGLRQALIISDENVARHHALAFAERIGAALVTMPPGEESKTLDTVARMYSALVESKTDRTTTVIGMGGGVVGDLAGFVAATYMRGVDFVQIPTSLLAMVDSSVGGKVGVDLPAGKNLVGAFKQPQAVLIDSDVLETLPDEEWRNGMAEVLKHGLLADAGLLDSALHGRENAPELVARAVKVKVNVVERDPYEQGERAHLNLGHTFGHAIEQVSGYQWAHGQAVGVGLLAAVMLSHRLGFCEQALVDQVDEMLRAVGLPRRLGDLSPSALWEAMHTDKKWQAGKNRFVLLRGIGAPFIMEGIHRDDAVSVLEALR